jgi:hypothetical protein
VGPPCGDSAVALRGEIPDGVISDKAVQQVHFLAAQVAAAVCEHAASVVGTVTLALKRIAQPCLEALGEERLVDWAEWRPYGNVDLHGGRVDVHVGRRCCSCCVGCAVVM